MGRALTIQRTLVTPNEREKFQDKLRRKQEYYQARGVACEVLDPQSLSEAAHGHHHPSFAPVAKDVAGYDGYCPKSQCR